MAILTLVGHTGLSLLTLVVTDACNFSCSYCTQIKGKRFLSWQKARLFLERFLPRLVDGGAVNFYGGEPLLAFELVKRTCEWIQARKGKGGGQVQLGIATNGSLLTREIIEFLGRHAFRLVFSFDGLAQDQARRDGTFDKQVTMLRSLINIPGLSLHVSSVFTARTAHHLSRSLAFIHDLGVKDILLSIDTCHPWSEAQLALLEEQMTTLTGLCKKWQDEGGIPVAGFRPSRKRGIFACLAGRDRLSLDAAGRVWGCHLFSDQYGGADHGADPAGFCLGSIEALIGRNDSHLSQALSVYDGLSQNMFFTAEGRFCFLCREWRSCSSCPAMGLRLTGTLGCLPEWHCRIKQIERAAAKRLRTAGR